MGINTNGNKILNHNLQQYKKAKQNMNSFFRSHDVENLIAKITGIETELQSIEN